MEGVGYTPGYTPGPFPEDGVVPPVITRKKTTRKKKIEFAATVNLGSRCLLIFLFFWK